jgi:hypothetical protein
MLYRNLVASLVLAAAPNGTAAAAEPMANAEAMAKIEHAASQKPGVDHAAARASESSASQQHDARSEPSAPQGDRERPAPQGDKELSGMSILGNQEAPKALVIVPWKSSEIGDRIGLNDNLDDSRRPVDKEVFLRELRYYEIRSGKE